MRCKEILAEIQEFNLRTWLTNLDIAKSNNEEYENESWFEKGLKNFKDSDWMMEVDRFHLSDENTKNHLISIASSI